jgi:hypothetical protein
VVDRHRILAIESSCDETSLAVVDAFWPEAIAFCPEALSGGQLPRPSLAPSEPSFAVC